mmetsp:Transcript_1300/g.4587  ORF Transcript_1300/g.4587 Transcript_1300/m.4587 type:complete len:234 (+) Transcript_1300:668-1369(+)
MSISSADRPGVRLRTRRDAMHRAIRAEKDAARRHNRVEQNTSHAALKALRVVCLIGRPCVRAADGVPMFQLIWKVSRWAVLTMYCVVTKGRRYSPKMHFHSSPGCAARQVSVTRPSTLAEAYTSRVCSARDTTLESYGAMSIHNGASKTTRTSTSTPSAASTDDTKSSVDIAPRPPAEQPPNTPVWRLPVEDRPRPCRKKSRNVASTTRRPRKCQPNVSLEAARSPRYASDVQ